MLSLDSKQHCVSTAGAQYVQPPEWPQDVLFSTRNCDRRQWALMLWSVLEHADAESIYAGRNASRASRSSMLSSLVSCPGWTRKATRSWFRWFRPGCSRQASGRSSPPARTSTQLRSQTRCICISASEYSSSSAPAAANDNKPSNQVILASSDADA
jgi:hypothetical protein